MRIVPCPVHHPRLTTGKCDIKYLVYPADTYASVANMALRVSNATVNVTHEELCCYNQVPLIMLLFVVCRELVLVK